MKILLAILIGVVYSFLMPLGLIGVGKVLEKTNNHTHRFLNWLIGLILLIIYFGALGLGIGLLIKNFQLVLKAWGIGFVLGWFLYIPFAKWKKLYK